MNQPFRLAYGGHIDRTKPLEFSFNARRYQGYAGDTLASALVANGVRLLGRSFKYHRPRGLMAAGVDEPNAIVDVLYGDTRLPNLKATEVELSQGLQAFSVNHWPSLDLDLGATANILSRFLPAGFYYKTFFKPHWHLYEGAIRRAAGLGRLDLDSKSSRVDQITTHCDALIIGAGKMGLKAAREQAATGQDVLLVEQSPSLGGSARWRSDEIEHPREHLNNAVRAVTIHPRIRFMCKTTAQGIYDGNHVMLLEQLEPVACQAPRQRVWIVRAKTITLATGALERPLVFPGNDRPGIMLASAVEQYINLYAVRPGSKAVIVTNNDAACASIPALKSAGIDVAAIVDVRAVPGNCLNHGVPMINGAILGTRGRNTVSAITVQADEGHKKTLDCDLLIMSGGLTPTVQLHSQLGTKLFFDESFGAFLADGTEPPIYPAYRISKAIQTARSKQMAFVDFQNDVTTADLELARREHYKSIEHIKRYTTLGMATDQGKSSNINAINHISNHNGVASETIGTTRYRPPFTPVAVGAYTGRRTGELSRPQRRLLLHAWHESKKAECEEFGEWLRPAWYAINGSDRAHAIRSEASAVRNQVGIFDNSPLGKIEVVGADAAGFLDFIYANTMSTLHVGACRYGLMLNEQGVIIDDGVVSRISEQHFWVTTTSGGATRVAAWLEEWRQCEFPKSGIIIAPVTSRYSVPTVSGPKARDLLAMLSPDFDISAAAFPHMTFRTGALAGSPVLVARVSYTGELSYEISVSTDRAEALWGHIVSAGASFGLCPVGIDAWMELRTEKGYLHVGTDTDGTTTADDVGWSQIHRRKSDFAGRRSLLRPANTRQDRFQLVGIQTTSPQLVPEPGDHLTDGTAPTIGYITSSCFSQTLGRSVAMAMVRGGMMRIGQEIRLRPSGDPVRIVARAAFDPQGARLHA
ncbi:MAG: 2Fe-2S iron-sulfur cluster-binding protein [Micropepsaceae bacterium]